MEENIFPKAQKVDMAWTSFIWALIMWVVAIGLKSTWSFGLAVLCTVAFLYYFVSYRRQVAQDEFEADKIKDLTGYHKISVGEFDLYYGDIEDHSFASITIFLRPEDRKTPDKLAKFGENFRNRKAHLDYVMVSYAQAHRPDFADISPNSFFVQWYVDELFSGRRNRGYVNVHLRAGY